MIEDAFENPEILARWVSDTLSQKGISDIAKWRMLEYWMQVELYRAIEAGKAGQWKYLGEYEQPYYTDMPRSGSKYNTKWVDMVVVEPSIQKPKRIVWIELKDIGRNKRTFKANLKGLGQDLAALWRLRVKETKQIWLNPPPHAVDKSRETEWRSLVPALDVNEHFISQIVIMPRNLVSQFGEEFIIETWLGSFEQRSHVTDTDHGIELAKYDNDGFTTFSTVVPLPECSG